MTETVTTDFAGNESASVVRQRLTDILTYHGFTPAAYANWGAARADINVMLAVAGQTLLTNEEIAASFMAKLNAINRRSLAAQRLFSAGEQGAWFDPGNIATLFQDTAGTVPVTAPGQTVARINDRSGRGNHATQATAASRPVYGVQPRSGVRNLANGSADVGGNLSWVSSNAFGGMTVTRIASGTDIDGLPYVDYRFQGTATQQVFITASIFGSSRVAASVGQQFTSSIRAQRLAGTAPATPSGLYVEVAEENSAGNTHIANTAHFLPADSSTEVLLSATRTIASGNQARSGVTLRVENGTTVDVTYRLKALQFEQGNARTAYQRNFSALNVTEDGVPTVGFLQFDGVDDWLMTPTITPGTDKAQWFAGVRKFSDAVRGIVAEMTFSGQRMNLEAPGASASTDRYMAASGGGTIIGAATLSSAFNAPHTAVLAASGDIAAPSISLRINGGAGAVNNTASQGASGYPATPLFIGRRAGVEHPFNGRLFSLIARFGPNLSPAEIARTETWVNSRTGAY